MSVKPCWSFVLQYACVLCTCGASVGVFFGLSDSVMFTLGYVGGNVPRIVFDGLLEIQDIVMFISSINFVLSDNVNLVSFDCNRTYK